MSKLRNYLRTLNMSKLAIHSNIQYGTAIFLQEAVEIVAEDSNQAEAWCGGLNSSVKEGVVAVGEFSFGLMMTN